MGFARLDAYFKFFSDLLGAKAFGYGLEDFSLTIGKSAFLLALACSRQMGLAQMTRSFWLKVAASLDYFAYSFFKFGDG